MNLDLEGKVAIVTGASRGIGIAIAQQLQLEGAEVVGVARRANVEFQSIRTTVCADMSTRNGASFVVDVALQRFGRIDIIVNNVGAGDPQDLPVGGTVDVGDDAWQRMFEMNLFSAVRMTRAALPSLIVSKGSVISVSSVNAHVPATGPVGYSEAKAALNAFSKRVSEEVAALGVRVNTISPGPTDTSLWRQPDGVGARLAEAHGVSVDDVLAGIPAQFGMTTGRMTKPEEIAALVAFVASTRSPNMTGSEILVDGGVLKSV